jgi:L-threonylcarbamoyladenylate synthase
MDDQIKQAATFIKEGKIVAFPTETVYGLGVDYQNEKALNDLFQLKERDLSKPFTLHVSSVEQIENIAADLKETFYALAKAFLPGPLTIIVKTNAILSSLITKCQEDGVVTVGFRFPSNPIALALINEIKCPIAATSANYSTKQDSVSVKEVKTCFANKIPFILDGGKTQFEQPSTIISLMQNTPKILRQGVITKEQIESVLHVDLF